MCILKLNEVEAALGLEDGIRQPQDNVCLNFFPKSQNCSLSGAGGTPVLHDDTKGT